MLENATASSATYQVQLPVFSGPMELLLHLIERGQLDITLVSLATVTDQYVAYVENMAAPDPDELADFLVIAARLLAIKANVLLARPNEKPGDEEDAEELLRALRDYQLFKHVAEELRAREADERRAYPRVVPTTPIVRPCAPDGLTAADLLAALQRRLAAVPDTPQPTTVPEGHEYTVAEKLVFIEQRLSESGIARFSELLDSAASRLELIVTFLALLELLKQHRVEVVQAAVFGEIEIALAISPNGDQEPALAGSTALTKEFGLAEVPSNGGL